LLAALEGLHYQAHGTGVAVHALCPGMVRSDILDLQRYPEAGPLRPASGKPPNPFEAHVARAMRHAEPASDFAERVLQGLAIEEEKVPLLRRQAFADFFVGAKAPCLGCGRLQT
jgi:short-subunit dehydrogenase